MEISRREILKSLGLGGLAITMPRPFIDLAEKLAKIKPSPVRVLKVSFTPSIDFDMDRFVVNVSTSDEGRRFMEQTKFKMFWPHKNREDEIRREMGCSRMFDEMQFPQRILIPKDETVEVYFAPVREYADQWHPVSLDMRLEGMVMCRPEERPTKFYAVMNKTEHVLMDRDRALKLGLVGQDEPWGVI